MTSTDILLANDTDVAIHHTNCTVLIGKANSVLEILKLWVDANKLNFSENLWKNATFQFFMLETIFQMLAQTTLSLMMLASVRTTALNVKVS